MVKTLVNKQKIKAIAFYLPQFHPIPENDKWWGKGFTEWTNVAQAKPVFPGHYQPHIPADLGFYDLRLEETRIAQAELARQYGIHGFCYYHYWFNGKMLLERPFNEVLASGKPDFPFCLCWANENWTRAWDGKEKDVLMRQDYNKEDDREHIKSLLSAFDDARYIRIDGKPLFLVYRTELLPYPKHTTEIWREEAYKAGLGELYLANVQSLGRYGNPEEIGFNASVEFAPDWNCLGPFQNRSKLRQFLKSVNKNYKVFFDHRVYSYDKLITNMLGKTLPNFKLYRCVTPSWDNSPRRQTCATILSGSTPGKYQMWLEKVINQTENINSLDEKIIFINAWNEWAEGCHLEPDQIYGHQYLQATFNALKGD